MVEQAPERSWKLPQVVQLTARLHLAGVAGLAAIPSAWPWIVSSLVLNHVVLTVAGITPRCRLLGANLSRLPARQRERGEVALTFDDGPDPRVTPTVLDLLDEYAAQATFFLIGQRAEEHPGLVAEIVRRGHRVENHTYHHPYTFAFFGPQAQAREIDRAQEILESTSGCRPTLFRAPAGIRNLWLDRVLAKRRMQLVSWNRRGYDTVDRDPGRVARRLCEDLSAGDIALLHDGSVAHDRNGSPVVLEVLPRLLDTLAERGLQAAYIQPRS